MKSARTDPNQKTLVTCTSSMQDAGNWPDEHHHGVRRVGAVARHCLSRSSERVQLERQSLAFANHSSAARCEEHTRGSSLDEQLSRSQAKPAKATRDCVQARRYQRAPRHDRYA